MGGERGRPPRYRRGVEDARRAEKAREIEAAREALWQEVEELKHRPGVTPEETAAAVEKASQAERYLDHPGQAGWTIVRVSLDRALRGVLDHPVLSQSKEEVTQARRFHCDLSLQNLERLLTARAQAQGAAQAKPGKPRGLWARLLRRRG